MSKLKDFLKELGSNSQLLESYKESPEKTMQKYGLSEKETAAVHNLDMDKIRELAGDECDYLVIVHNISEHKM